MKATEVRVIEEYPDSDAESAPPLPNALQLWNVRE